MYEKAVIYKLCCLDPEIKECYVGSTCNLYLRKSQHKHSCNNPNDKYYNFKVYQFIRENGGWNNWQMILLEQYPCNSKLEMHMRERYWFENLGATLNSQYPNRTKKEWEEANPEKVKEYQKEYREANPEYQKEYRETNAEQLKEYQKKYREANAEKIRERKSEKIKCKCGAEINYSSMSNHRKTKKHLQKMIYILH